MHRVGMGASIAIVREEESCLDRRRMEAVIRTRTVRFILSSLIILTPLIALLLFPSTTLLSSLICFHLSLISLTLSLSLPSPLSLSFVAIAGIAGCVELLLIFGWGFGIIRGFAVGFVYGVFYLYNRRSVLDDFPMIQRSSFFSFKIRIPSAAYRASHLSIIAYAFSAVLAIFTPYESKACTTIGKFISKQFDFFTGIFMVFLCWELNHHLHQVVLTKRVIFAPPIGSAAAITNPSEPLLAALEESKPRSLIQYLAYLDLCMICENNVDTWRRADFFENTGETYKRVMAACLKPLEQLVSEIVAGLESNN